MLETLRDFEMNEIILTKIHLNDTIWKVEPESLTIAKLVCMNLREDFNCFNFVHDMLKGAMVLEINDKLGILLEHPCVSTVKSGVPFI